MEPGAQPIENLKKVTLTVETGSSAAAMDLSHRPTVFEFVYGVGSQGLTPFEYELAGKCEGDEALIHVRREDMPTFFQHLMFPSLDVPDRLDAFFLKVRVVRVVPADQKEMLKALAEVADCGDACCGH